MLPASVTRRDGILGIMPVLERQDTFYILSFSPVISIMVLLPETSATLSPDNTDRKDVSYSLFYFNFHGLGACPRALLCFGNATWTNKIQSMSDWPKVKPTTPFGTLPILYETEISTGSTIEIPESGAIERYLARKFSLLGDTPREQTLNDIFYAQAVMLNTKFVAKVVWTFDQVR
ncbi:hypothetical protein BGX26_000610 [Mortierella sp. AD094]|nr:hypothetical protein BGX26_000610 [Mortierella sp. AD094]